ncbi:MAG: phosphoribosylpyrophosphate synthetase [Rhodobacterales bacterium RIFCSPHIGHO2_02_FULL_62_130]|jgi:ribose-phosphate pyrophosphokinase|nr:MAG: phosphoribosylpyrophosphate synthetase [Rhodobacterales bacterium RIFCSPHIGHO2_02_FULL_62_130]OHC57406.1 MAG: phosphoribosylpyrophosphate synthetase [Rhodobacterales bacterium RIFCSPHIGHO2_12_FULL_62_75]HCZ01201.1 phosphoribosylpyrophosphate synthetase [Rhodobacter sp.]
MIPLIYALPGNEAFAGALARHLVAETGHIETRTFPDGETYLRLLTEPMERDVILVCTLDRPDAKLAPLIFAADTARSLGARRVGLVAPYLCYLRQDRRFHSGEAITSKSIGCILSASFDWLITVDPHLHRYASLGEVYTLASRVVAAAPCLADWISRNVPNPVLIGPDVESQQWVAQVAEQAGAPWQVLEKERLGDLDVRISLPDPDRLRGRTPVLVDDIISSARTMIAAARHVTDIGCPPPVCLAVHAIFAAESHALLTAAAGRIVTTNTVTHGTNKIDMAADIASSIAGLLREA